MPGSLDKLGMTAKGRQTGFHWYPCFKAQSFPFTGRAKAPGEPFWIPDAASGEAGAEQQEQEDEVDGVEDHVHGDGDPERAGADIGEAQGQGHDDQRGE